MQIPIIIIPLRGKIYDKRRRWYRRVTVRGYLLGFCCAVVAGCSVWLFQVSQAEQEANEKELRKELKARDNEHQRAIIDAGKEYIDKLSKNQIQTAEALAKYGLKYDETRDQIIKIVKTDTLRPNLAPHIDIADEGIKLDSVNKKTNIYYFTFRLKNTVSPAKNTHLNMYILEATDTTIRFKRDVYMMLSGNDLMYNSTMESGSHAIPVKKDADKVYFYFFGNFMDSNNKKYEMRRVYFYDLKTKTHGLPSSYEFLTIKELLTRNGLY